MKSEDFLEVAKLGKTVGLRGDLKLHLLCDFPEQFVTGQSFDTKKFGKLTISFVDTNRSLVRFENYEDINLAKPLTNTLILSTKEKTRKTCKLKENEFFWFDLIGLDIVEDEKTLGNIQSIERIAEQDYLSVLTDESLVQQKLAKSFLIPYVPRYIKKVDLEQKHIQTLDALGILESS